MAVPIEHPQKPSRQKGSRVPLIVLVLFLAGCGVLLFRPMGILVMGYLLRGTSHSGIPANALDSVSRSLMGWEIFGPLADIQSANKQRSMASGMQCTNGFTQSDGFHGDGTDWYELKLTPELAAELRTNLAKSTTVTKNKYFPQEVVAPGWWPKSWPPDAQCYHKDSAHLILPDTGTRAWFLRVRS